VKPDWKRHLQASEILNRFSTCLHKIYYKTKLVGHTTFGQSVDDG